MSHNVGTLFVRNTKEKEMATAPYFDGTQLCMTIDSEIFFPKGHATGSKKSKAIYEKQASVGKDICRDCHFVVDCLKYALSNDVVGIWGATDEKERTILRKEMNLPKPKSIHMIVKEFAK
jgi:hypothetical protein